MLSGLSIENSRAAEAKDQQGKTDSKKRQK
jgi:hypothetical protein